MSKPASDVHSQSTDGGPTEVDHSSRVYPSSNQTRLDGDESQHVWGFTDTRYQVTDDKEVEITGSRYATSGQKIPNLLPWISSLMKIRVPEKPHLPVTPEPMTLPEGRTSEEFLHSMKAVLKDDQISLDPLQRLRHSHGHSFQDVYQVNYEPHVIKRMPDVVLFPATTEQVLDIVEAARATNTTVISYGGGTNVSQALSCPDDEERMIATVSLRNMSRILWIDKENRLARIQAGAVGRNITATLSEYGMTFGHEPDSVEFSTLGGWIAAKASGMKKNRYGNIEDLVLDVEMVTVEGIVARAADNTPPRESVGLDLKSWAFGSEGALGIVTSAVVKIFPLPEIARYGSILFKTFDQGLAFMYDLAQSGQQPASARLVDNTQFQFSQALKPASTGLRAVKSRLEKAYVTRVRAFDPQQMVACTLVFEGSAKQVKSQGSAVYALAKRHGGMKAGAANGKKGYEMTFAIAYIRDFAMSLNIFAESFETSCTWSGAARLCQRVKERVRAEHKALALPGEPFFSSRISQIYDTGVTVYFYLAIFVDGDRSPVKTYSALEEAARDEILQCGGSLSHHHGVGNLRRKFLLRVNSPAARSYRSRIQNAVDPNHVFLAGRGLAGSEV